MHCLQNARVGTAVPCLPSMKAPYWHILDLLAILRFPMIADAISQMEIGGNRRLVYPKAKQTGAVNGGAAVHLDH